MRRADRSTVAPYRLGAESWNGTCRLPRAAILCLLLTGAGYACGASARAQGAAAAATPSAESHSGSRTRSAVGGDPQYAFVEGYNAYRNHDPALAVERLKPVAAGYPQLGDYALYYLGLAERELGQREEAVATMRRLSGSYPQSVFAERAELATAAMELGRAGEASALAARLMGETAEAQIEQEARIVLARALMASNDPRGAYEQLETLRSRYPREAADAQARTIEQSLLAAHPEIVNVNSLAYRRSEAELLLKEGLAAEAAAESEAALRLKPPRAIRAELFWIEARAEHSNPPRAKYAAGEYLELEPDGAHAAAALDMIGHIFWNEDDTERARVFFYRLVGEFPASPIAPEALLAIGRSFEDERELDRARTAYERLYAAYPSSEAAVEARFRAAFTLYMDGDYEAAARRFAAMSERAADGAERDRLGYWRARALEKAGKSRQARPIYSSVALSIESNYYPALAGLRIGVRPPTIPAASAPDPGRDAPPALGGDAGFHLRRALALRSLGLENLAPAELKALESFTPGIPALRGFVLAGYQDAGAWHLAVRGAERMAARGEIAPEMAERIRYPRAYWDLILSAATRDRLDPYLLLALTRQESLFDPHARSSSDARGLMQLLPTTAVRVASVPGASRLDLYNPAINIELGSSYLRQLLSQFNGDRFRAVAAYNGGEHAVEKWRAKFPGDDDQWVENIGYRETRDYVKKVIGGLREYRLLYQSRAAGLRP